MPTTSMKPIFDRIIFHVDMDSFYASCELRRKPEFKDEPFIVGADPKEGKGRGVVVACNYAARKYGIHSGMPVSRAWEICSKAVFVKPDFDLYEEVSKQVMNLIRPFADKLEQVSIDEAYLDVTERIHSVLAEELGKSDEGKLIQALASSIKKSVLENEHITCSIGVANTKIVAKIATDMQKPDGLTIVEPEKVKDFLAPLPVSKIPGVGKVSQRILEEKFGAKTISDLRRVDVDDLKEKFGRNAIWLMNAASGIDPSEVIERWAPISLSGETTFDQDESDYSKIKDVMYEVAKDVHRRVLAEGYMFHSVGIKIRFTGFETHTRSRSLLSHNASLDVLMRECEKLLSEFYDSGKSVRLIGVKVSSLEKKEKEQLTLLDYLQS